MNRKKEQPDAKFPKKKNLAPDAQTSPLNSDTTTKPANTVETAPPKPRSDPEKFTVDYWKPELPDIDLDDSYLGASPEISFIDSVKKVQEGANSKAQARTKTKTKTKTKKKSNLFWDPKRIFAQ